MAQNRNEILTKQKQYESKIMQFMNKEEKSSRQGQRLLQIVKDHKQYQSQKKIDHDIQKDRQQIGFSMKDIGLKQKTKTKQSQRRSIRQNKPQSLRRKATLLLASQHNINLSSVDNNPQHPPNHKSLLQKIQSKIQLINEKISQQISKQQTQLLNEYQNKLRSKQQLLNKLKMTTNQQMIKQKTLQRKQQLKREKMSLIQANIYYHQKLQTIKSQLNRLLENKQSYEHTLKMLNGQGEKMSSNDNGKNCQSNRNQQNSNNNKQQPLTYFGNSNINNQDNNNQNNHSKFVQKVLSNYNSTKLFNNQQKQLSSPRSKIQQQRKSFTNNNNYTQQSRLINKESILPKISQKPLSNSNKLTKSTSLVNDNNGNDFYSYRKMKNNRFDRVRSIGVFDANNKHSLIDNTKLNNITDRKYKNISNPRIQRVVQMFNYTNKNNDKTIKKDKQDTSKQFVNKTVNVQNESNKNIAPAVITREKNNNNNNILYTKQQLQQFVVKKLNYNNIINSSNNNNSNIINSSNNNNSNIINSNNNNNSNNEKQILKQSKQSQQRIRQKEQKQKTKSKKNNRHKQLIQQLFKTIQQLQLPLGIQQMFNQTIQQYYNDKQINRIKCNNINEIDNNFNKHIQSQNRVKQTNIDNLLATIDQGLLLQQKYSLKRGLLQSANLLQKEKTNSPNLSNDQIQMIDYKKALTQLQNNQFEKRIIVDLLFSRLQFKQYLYNLIVSEFQSNQQKPQHQPNLQTVINKFNHHQFT